MAMERAGTSGVLVVGGPTASGKTGLAIAIAQRYDCEIVGADSRQIYCDMPIGTAAPTPEERARVPHHLVGFLDPYQRYSAARFVIDAAAAIGAIHLRGKRAIVVGGTGFYLRALCGDVGLADEPDRTQRERMQREALVHSSDVLHDWLRSRAPQRAAAISPHDRYRVVRALEIELSAEVKRTSTAPIGTSVDTFAQVRPLPTLRAAGLSFAKVAVHVERTELAQRIARRTDAMIAAGLIAEAEHIGGNAIAADAVGYREALAYQCGWLTLDEMRRNLIRATQRYAKRQATWFRAESDLHWMAPGDCAAVAGVARSLGWKPA